MAILPTGRPDSRRRSAQRKLPLGALTAFVIFTMMGSGMFILSQNMDIEAWWLPLVVGWGGTAAGMVALVLVFQPLAAGQEDFRQEAPGEQADVAQPPALTRTWRWVLVLAVAAYGCLVTYLIGPAYLLMCAVLSVPGILFFIWARRETGQRSIGPLEAALTTIIVILALLATFHMWTGVVSPP